MLPSKRLWVWLGTFDGRLCWPWYGYVFQWIHRNPKMLRMGHPVFKFSFQSSEHIYTKIICAHTELILLRIEQIMNEYDNLQNSFGELYFAVKHTGHQTAQRISSIEQKTDSFCQKFEKLCVIGDKQPTPRNHVLKKHTLPFIQLFGMSWWASEEAAEQVYHQLSAHIERNTHQHRQQTKLLGRFTTIQYDCSFKFQKQVTSLAAGGTCRKRKTKPN